VDGTYNFLSGLPFWCSALALAERTGPGAPWTPVLGAVYHPFADELWLGGLDHPTSLNGIAVEPLGDQPLSQGSLASYLHPATLGGADVREPVLAMLGGAATVRMLGSGSVELASVAAGRLGAWAQRNTLAWDWLPGAALVQAAGGSTRVLEHRGSRWHLAGNRQAVGELAGLLLGA
jgi:myo-inositol-1(or 4)-monophosphatase